MEIYIEYDLQIRIIRNKPEIGHSTCVLSFVTVRVPSDVGSRPCPHIFVIILEAVGPTNTILILMLIMM